VWHNFRIHEPGNAPGGKNAVTKFRASNGRIVAYRELKFPPREVPLTRILLGASVRFAKNDQALLMLVRSAGVEGALEELIANAEVPVR
jgi:hypothetical protein